MLSSTMDKKLISIFDFDGTLTMNGMPKYSFLDKFGYKNGMQDERFLKEALEHHLKSGKDYVRDFLEYALKIANDNNLQLTLPILCEGQETIGWNIGVDTFFDTLARTAKNRKTSNKNYVITSGVEEYVNNLPIAEHFSMVYGSCLEMDERQNILGIEKSMTDELKVKYIKNILMQNGKPVDDCSDVVYVGDGLTDEAPMQYVHKHGGKIIYISYKTANSLQGYKDLNKDVQIVDYNCSADFSPTGDVVKAFTEIMNHKEYARHFTTIDKHGVWPDDTSPDAIISQAKQAVANIIATENYTKLKKLYRLAGQSGSGKSTQLLPTVLNYEESRGNTPITIAVRTFAKYHPRYDDLAKTIPAGAIREATNGFGLKCLCAAYAMLLEMGYLTIVDLTIMEPCFEEFMLSQAQINNYQAEYHVLAVNKNLSNSFIEKRKNDPSHPEYGKIVNTSSIDFWYNALPRGIKFLAENDATNICFVWSAHKEEPLHYGIISERTTTALDTGRAELGEQKIDEQTLRQGKLEFLIKSAR